MNKLEIVLATNNQSKIKEYKDIFEGYNVKLYSLKELNINVDVDETGTTYDENAFLKAQAISRLTDKIVLSDDSGVEINDLGKHFPGIHTHRYANEMGGQDKVNKYLTSSYPGSLAHYECSICVMNLKSEPLYFHGIFTGKIDNKISGTNGFGYDPIFIPDGYNSSTATLDEKTKNKISHRGLACKEFIKYLINNGVI